jgi:hypothetical protein
MTQEDLIKLGIPKLPDGYFFRIRIPPMPTLCPLNVQIRKKTRFGSRPAGYFDKDCMTNERSIRDACIALHDWFSTYDEEAMANQKIFDKYLGDH